MDGASSTGDSASVRALDACITMMDTWWDERVCPPGEDDAAWCVTKSGDSAFTDGDRLDVCTLLVTDYAIPDLVEQPDLDQCLADMLTPECWAWRAEIDDCADSTCSPACDAIRVLEFCYRLGGDVCPPASPLEGC